MKSYMLEITALTKLQEFEYCQMQHEVGTEWLKANKAEWVFEDTKLFWNWWKNQWAMRDVAFLTEFSDPRLPAYLILLSYRNHHRIEHLMSVYPTNRILEKSYSDLTTQVVKQARKGVHHG